jgi:hypothetical protein
MLMNDKRIEIFPEIYNSTAIFKHSRSVFTLPKYKATKQNLYFSGEELRDFMIVTWKLCSVS